MAKRITSRQVFAAYAASLGCAIKDAMRDPLACSIVVESVGAGDPRVSSDEGAAVVLRLERIIEDIARILFSLKQHPVAASPSLGSPIPHHEDET